MVKNALTAELLKIPKFLLAHPHADAIAQFIEPLLTQLFDFPQPLKLWSINH